MDQCMDWICRVDWSLTTQLCATLAGLSIAATALLLNLGNDLTNVRNATIDHIADLEKKNTQEEYIKPFKERKKKQQKKVDIAVKGSRYMRFATLAFLLSLVLGVTLDPIANGDYKLTDKHPITWQWIDVGLSSLLLWMGIALTIVAIKELRHLID